jgi:DNA mismatch repair protein MutS2
VKSSSSEALAFPQVVALIRRYISTAAGAAALELVTPSSDQPAVEQALAETREGIQYLRAASNPAAGSGSAIRVNLGGVPDITRAVQKLAIEGASLDPGEIYNLIAFLDRAADARSLLTASPERFPLLARLADAIADFRELLKAVQGKVLPDGTVPDSASPHLNRLRREVEKQKKSIGDSLDRFLRANRGEGVLQEEYVTLRNERFVVPVIAGQRRKLPGVIHGASSSGQTLFLEPLETIDLNNELVRLQEEELREVYRILQELTNRLRVQVGDIRVAAGVIAHLDLIFAKARFGVDFDCAIPTFGERFHVQNARHPLLMDVLKKSRKAVVPFDLTLDRECRTLLISGPNTGGKTVTLKTAGVIALMAQSGFPVPCFSAELPLFEQVLADIGDHQSIEQNLSTFSAHVARLREMALDVTPASLVLLDEIGSATDPEEGGALGVALVDHFRAAGAFTLASTHLTALKVYGASTKSVLNASMGFDEETLQPTYRLRIGVPGKSAGLDIATKLGMPEDILKRARAALSSQEIELGRLIAGLHDSLEQATRQRAELESEKLAIAAREREFRADWERRETTKIRELEERFDKMQAEWRKRSDELIARVEEVSTQRKAGDKIQREVAKAGREMRENWEAAVTGPKANAPGKTLRIEEGVRVRIKGIRELARVSKDLGNGRYEVEAGFLRMKIGAEDVEEVFADTPATKTSKLPSNVRFQSGPALSPLVQEINIIGERAEEASDRVERFLDAAVMATAARVRIVHGHGMGILKRMIQDLLKANPHVEKFYPASQSEGGAGATIAELKD